jgi:hypothetical protein
MGRCPPWNRELIVGLDTHNKFFSTMGMGIRCMPSEVLGRSSASGMIAHPKRCFSPRRPKSALKHLKIVAVNL